MATIKQKSLKPSTNLPFSQGMLVYNGTGASIPADTLVSFTSGVNGVQAKVVKAVVATSSAAVKGQAMLVTKHAIPDGKSGVVLPWKIIDHDTSSGFTASAAGFVYLSAATAGAFVGSAPGSSKDRVVGLCLVAATAGKILLAPYMFGHVTSAN
tara:strand:+ start:269 stop:730 length:462 start_codon:yes stop_codon:yes gene_type:complete